MQEESKLAKEPELRNLYESLKQQNDFTHEIILTIKQKLDDIYRYDEKVSLEEKSQELKQPSCAIDGFRQEFARRNILNSRLENLAEHLRQII
jgi:hypothetical protein